MHWRCHSDTNLCQTSHVMSIREIIFRTITKEGIGKITDQNLKKSTSQRSKNQCPKPWPDSLALAFQDLEPPKPWPGHQLWPGLAWPIWAWPGLAFGLWPGHAHHYLNCLQHSAMMPPVIGMWCLWGQNTTKTPQNLICRVWGVVNNPIRVAWRVWDEMQEGIQSMWRRIVKCSRCWGQWRWWMWKAMCRQKWSCSTMDNTQQYLRSMFAV